MSENTIHWVKWVDPVAHLIYNKKLDSNEDLDELVARSARDEFRDDAEPAYRAHADKGSLTGPCLVGPMGVVPVHEEILPGRMFNFWMGHTNFDLSPSVVDTISEVPGVETLDVFTRYRFRMGIGKAFSASDVKQAVDRAVKIENVFEPKPAEKLASVKAMLARKYKFWAIYVMPDGHHEMAGGNSADEVMTKGKRFQESAKEVSKSW